MKKFTYAIVAILAIALFATACSNPSDSSRKGGETAHDEQEAVQTGFNRLSDSQQAQLCQVKHVGAGSAAHIQRQPGWGKPPG